MKCKKTLSLFLSLVMLFVITGCGDKITGSGSTNKGKKDEPVDMGGYEFVLATAWRRDTPPRDATIFERMWHDRKSQVETDYNCSIKIKKFYANSESLTPSILAGEKVGDVVEMIPEMIYPAIGAGYLRPWDDVKDIIDFNDSRWRNSASHTVKGKHYGLSYGDADEPGTILFYNRDVLKKAGVTEDPGQLALDGNWTWEKFRSMLQACTMDTDNDGQKDIYGLVSCQNYSDLGFAFARSNGGYLVDIKGDKYTKGFTSPEFLEGINFLSQLVDDDKVVKLYGSMATQDTWNDMPGGVTIYNEFRNGQVAFMSSRMWVANQQIKPYMKGDYGMVVFPKGPKAKDYIQDGQIVGGGYTLTVTNKDYEKSAIIFNALAKPLEEYEDNDAWNELIASDFFKDGDEISMKNYKLALDHVQGDLGYGVKNIVAGLNHIVLASVFWHETTPAAAFEKVKDLGNDEIESTYAKILK